MGSATPAETVEVAINGRWPLRLPAHRAARPEWPTWEQERLDSMHRWITKRDRPVVYDVGAKEGDMSALYASWGARVHCFEPNPAVWPNIRTCFQANGLMPHHCYVGFAGDVDRNWTDALPVSVGTWPDAADGPVTVDHGFCQLNEQPDLPAVTLDTYADYAGPPDAVTMDVEGSELRVLHGAGTLLATARPTLWVAVHPTFMRDQYGDAPQALHLLLESFGYVGRLLADVHEQHYVYRPQETT